MSPGCTREACSFRDNIERFNELDTVILGINMDPPEKHRRFKELHNLPFRLLSDEDGRVIQRYGVGKWLGLILNRVTIVIDKEGTVRYIYKSQLRPSSHVKKVLKVLEELQGKRDD